MSTYLLYFPDPSADIFLEGVQEGGVTKRATQCLSAGLTSTVSGLLHNPLNGGVDGEGDLWDVNVLLKVKETDFKFIDLLLNRGHQLVSVTVCMGECYYA